MSRDLYQIRNPWVRRAALVLLMVPISIPIVVLAIIEGAWAEGRREWGDCVWSIRRAWRGK